MTDSVDGVPWDEEKKARFAKLADKRPKDHTEVSELPSWSKLAMVDIALYGGSYNEVAEKYKRKGGTLKKWAHSPAGRKFRSELSERMDDPAQIAQWVIQSEQASQAVRYIVLADTAEETGDLVLAERIRSKLLVSGGGLKPPQKDRDDRPVFVLNLPGYTGTEPPTLEAVEVETEHRLLEGGDGS